MEELRPVEYKASGTLQRSLDPSGKMTRDEFDGLLGALLQARCIEIEEAEFEKDGQVIRFRKVRLTDAGREMRRAPMQLLISDGIVEEFSGQMQPPKRSKKGHSAQSSVRQQNGGVKTALATEPLVLTAEGEALAGRIREWRGTEAKRLRVPAYVVMHDRTVQALAQARPRNPNELLKVDGIGPAKVERFGEELLRLCAGN